jgi:hypothetical protein
VKKSWEEIKEFAKNNYSIEELDILFNSVYCAELNKYIELWMKGVERTLYEGKSPWFNGEHEWQSCTSGDCYYYNNDNELMYKFKQLFNDYLSR